MRTIAALLALVAAAVLALLYATGRALLDAANRLDAWMDEAHWPPKSAR